MKRKAVTRVLCAALSSLLVVTGSNVPVLAQTLAEAELTEDTRGYGGKGDQNKSRTEESITVSVTLGAGGTDASDWTQLAELTPYIANDEVEMLNRNITFGDEDSDGDIDSSDLFRYLESLKRGDVEYYATTSDMGDFYMSLFGISAGGSFSYWLNGINCSYGTPDLYDNDNFIVVAFTGEYNTWGETDDSAYDGHKGSTTYTSVSSILELAGQSTTDPGTTDPSTPSDPQTPSNSDISAKTKYLSKVDEALASSYTSSTTGTGMWQQLRIARFAKGTNKEAFANYQNWYAQNHGVTLGSKAVDDMRVLSVIDNETAKNNLLYGSGLTVDDVEDSSEALVYDKKAGMYAMDYILMALDLTGAGLEDDDLTNNLSDYTTTVSVRDDLVYTILNTAGCWGGGWWTYDTGEQNAQSLVPYYNRYTEVKTKLDEFEAQSYDHFMDASYTGSDFDASCAGEYVRFAALLSKEANNSTLAQHAMDVYNKIETIGLENTKYKGNTMDIWRMAIAEWGINEIAPSSSSTTPIDDSVLSFTIDPVSTSGIVSDTKAHISINKTVEGAKLYEVAISVPDKVTIKDVTSDIVFKDTIVWNVANNVFRATILKYDDSALSIVSGKDLLTLTFTTEEDVTGKFALISSVFRYSSEESLNAGLNFGNGAEEVDVPVIKPTSVVVTELYRGAESSRFISKNDKVIKVVVGSSIEIDGGLQFNIGEDSYKLYKNSDFTASNCQVYVGIVPVDTLLSDMSKINNYSIIKNDPRSVTFGDVNFDEAVDAGDALSVVRIWVGKDSISTGKTIIASNVTKDLDIDNADTLGIIEHVVNGAKFKVLN